MSEIIDFYNGLKNKNGVTIYDVWSFSYEDLEHVHNYIQWLFPITEPDYWNRDTPKLTPEDIATFHNSQELKMKLLGSFETMLDFWGLTIYYEEDGIYVDKGRNYVDRKDNWQTERNHNHLRITRVLHCLNELGLKKTAIAFFNCLMSLYSENEGVINEGTILFWKKAMVKNMKGELV